MKPGTIMAAVNYLTQIFHSVMMLNMMFQTISRSSASAKRIVVVLESDPVIAEMTESLAENGYAFKHERSGEKSTLYVAYNSGFGKAYGIEVLLGKFMEDGCVTIPDGFNMTGAKNPRDFFKTSDHTKCCRFTTS